MSSTALGAEKAIIFISDAHERGYILKSKKQLFRIVYYEKLKEVRYQDVYHKALVYCLGISDDTRKNIKSIYNFKTGCVKTECLHEGWQTSGSLKVVRMAFNLYCNGTPSVFDYDDAEEQVEIQLGSEWAGVELQMKTDAGLYPGTIPVGQDSVLCLENGGSKSYVLTCMVERNGVGMTVP